MILATATLEMECGKVIKILVVREGDDSLNCGLETLANDKEAFLEVIQEAARVKMDTDYCPMKRSAPVVRAPYPGSGHYISNRTPKGSGPYTYGRAKPERKPLTQQERKARAKLLAKKLAA